MNIKHIKHFRAAFSLRPFGRGAAFLRSIYLCLLIFLTACEGSSSSTSAQNSTPTPAYDSTVRVEPDLSKNAPNFTLDPLLPPGGDARPAKSGETGRERTAAGLPVIESKGIRADQLFAAPLKDTNARLTRLENAVVEIRKDLDAAMPAIDHLVSIEGDIQELVTQLKTLLNDQGISTADRDAMNIAPPDAPEPEGLVADEAIDGKSIAPLSAEELAPPPGAKVFDAKNPVEPDAGVSVEPPINSVIQNTITPPVSSAPKSAPASIAPLTANTPPQTTPPSAPVKTITPPVAPTTVPTTPLLKNISVENVRLGDHADKIRLVIDAPSPVKMNTDLDASEKILIIELTGADITPGVQTPKSALVKSITLKSTGVKTGQVILELLHDTTIKMSSVMPPSSTNPHTRAVIDLSK